MEIYKKYKIFIVDDNIFSLGMYERNLINLGYEDITTFSSGVEMLLKLVEGPDIIFLDHQMHPINGLEVLKLIKRFDPHIYVVMVSGQENLSIAIESLHHGAFDYIIKDDNENDKMKDVIVRIQTIHYLLLKNKKNPSDHLD